MKVKKIQAIHLLQLKTEYGRNSFAMSPTQWIKRTSAIGIISKDGRYSIEIYNHPDIAFKFIR